MKKLLILLLLITFVTPAYAEYVRGYYKSNGTYVNGYNRTRADYTKLNNYSTQGNYNPYTGQQGYKNPYPNYNNRRRNYGYGY